MSTRFVHQIDSFGSIIIPVIGSNVEWKDEMYIVMKINRKRCGIVSFDMNRINSRNLSKIIYEELNPIHVMYKRGKWYIYGKVENIRIAQQDEEDDYFF